MANAPTIKQDIKLNVIGLEEANRAIKVLEQAAEYANKVRESSTKLAEVQRDIVGLTQAAADFSGKGGKSFRKMLKNLTQKQNEYAKAVKEAEDKIESFRATQKRMAQEQAVDKDPTKLNPEDNKKIKNLTDGQVTSIGNMIKRRNELASATVSLVAAEISYREALEATREEMKNQSKQDRSLTRARGTGEVDGKPVRQVQARLPSSAAATKNLKEAREALIPITQAAMKAENDYRATLKATIKFLKAARVGEKDLGAARKETQRLLEWMERVQKKEAAAKAAQAQATETQTRKETVLDRILRRKTKTVKRATSANRKNAASMGIQQRRAHALSGVIGTLGGSMRNVATSILFHAKTGPIFALLAVIGAIRTVYSAVIRPAAEYDKMMAQVRKTTEMTARETDNFGRSLLKLSSRLGIAHGDLAKIAEVAGQMGIRGKNNLLEFTQTIAMMTQVTELTAEKAAAGIAAIGEAFELPIEQAQQMGSVINELSNNTTANAGKIIQALGKIGPTAHNIGISLAEASAMAATLIHSGFVAPRVGTTLRNVFSIIQSKAQIISKTLGMSMTDFNNELKDDALPVIQTYLKHINEMQGSAVHLQQVFGRENVAQIRALAQLLNTSLAKNLDLANVAFDEGTSLIEEYGRGIDNLATKMDRQGVRAKNWAINLGLNMKEGLESILTKLGEFTYPVPILEASRNAVSRELVRLNELYMERAEQIKEELIAADPQGMYDPDELSKSIKKDKTMGAIIRSIQRRLKDLNKLNDHIHEGNLEMGKLESMQKEFETRKEALVNSIAGTKLEGKTMGEIYADLEIFQETKHLQLQGQHPAAALSRWFRDMSKVEQQVLAIRDLDDQITTILLSRNKEELPELTLPFNLENYPDDWKVFLLAERTMERHKGILAKSQDLFQLQNQISENLKHLERLRGEHTDWNKKDDAGKYINLGGLAHVIPAAGQDVWTKVHDDGTIEIINDTALEWVKLNEMIDYATEVQELFHDRLAEYLELYERNARDVERLAKFGQDYNLPFFTPESLAIDAERTEPFRMVHDYSPMDYFINPSMRKDEAWDFIGDYFVGGDVGGKEILETFQNRFDVQTAFTWLENEFKTAIKNLDNKNVLTENLMNIFNLGDPKVVEKFAEHLGTTTEELMARLEEGLQMHSGQARALLENIHPILANMELWESMTYEAKEKVRNDLATIFADAFPDETAEGTFLPGLQRAIQMGIEELDHWIKDWHKRKGKIVKTFREEVEKIDETIDNITESLRVVNKFAKSFDFGTQNLDKFIQSLVSAIGSVGDFLEQMKRLEAEAKMMKASAEGGIGTVPKDWERSAFLKQILPLIGIMSSIKNIFDVFVNSFHDRSKRAEKQREEYMQLSKENRKKLEEKLEELLSDDQFAGNITGESRNTILPLLRAYIEEMERQSRLEERDRDDQKLVELGKPLHTALVQAGHLEDFETPLPSDPGYFWNLLEYLENQGQFQTETLDGLIRSMEFLTKFVDIDVNSTLTAFVKGLKMIKGVPESMIKSLEGMDISTETGQNLLRALLADWAEGIVFGEYEFGGITPADTQKIMDFLLGISGGREADESDIATLSVSRSITDVQANAVILLLEQSVYWLKEIAGHIGVTGSFPGPKIANPPNVATRENGMNKQAPHYHVDVNGDIGVTVPYDPDDPLFADAVGQAVASKVRRYGVRR